MPSEEAKVRPSLNRPRPVQQDQTLKKRRGVETYKFFQNWLRVTFQCLGGVFIVCHPGQPKYRCEHFTTWREPFVQYDIVWNPWINPRGFSTEKSVCWINPRGFSNEKFGCVLFFLFHEKAAEVQGKCAGPRTPDDVALRVSRTLQKDT